MWRLATKCKDRTCEPALTERLQRIRWRQTRRIDRLAAYAINRRADQEGVDLHPWRDANTGDGERDEGEFVVGTVCEYDNEFAADVNVIGIGRATAPGFIACAGSP